MAIGASQMSPCNHTARFMQRKRAALTESNRMGQVLVNSFPVEASFMDRIDCDCIDS